MPARIVRITGRLRRRLGRNERGATSVEYALVASVVSITAIAALMVFGGQVGTLYGLLKLICDVITGAGSG
jgi:Flp pilus assembly pilin Flp